jgi:aryl-alcohol dehydrogenase-like predicted oxidoreductase
VILGATSLKQLAENLGALKVEMTPERRQEISAIFG